MLKKLGSLFDGSGGFPLAGMMSGVEPVWASEIEPYPIRVTTARFPDMKHLGDVTKIDGAAIEPVDIITFGSPCQDLSVAGKQAGLHKGERSNLFFEAIRIIKEMRRSTDGIYPRIAIWENVPGAFSSNKGADFQAVLQAFCSVKDPAAHVPMPPKNKWGKSGVIVGDGWSVAWRTLDAQFWGVPQRRKRIYLIADFGSERAGEILFEQEGLRGHSAESGTAGQSAAGDAQGSVGGSGVRCLNYMGAVCYPIDSHQQDSRFKICEDGVCPTVPGQMGTGGNNGPMVLETFQNTGRGWWNKSDIAQTVRTPCGGDSTKANLVITKPLRRYIIRRLTPLECARLQGFPDYWCSDLGIENPTEEDISFWSEVWETHRKIIGASKKPKSRKQIIKWLQNPHSDSAEYKMWGNGIALPNAAHVVGCAVKLIKETQT